MIEQRSDIEALDDKQKMLRVSLQIQEMELQRAHGQCARCSSHREELSEQLRGMINWVASVANDRQQCSIEREQQPTLLLRHQQERFDHIESLQEWNARYDLHQRYRCVEEASQKAVLSSQYHDIVDESIIALRAPLADLSVEQKLRESCVILGEIHRQRASLRRRLLTAPVSSLRQAAITAGSTAITAGMTAGALMALLTTGGSYCYEWRSTHVQSCKLPPIEQQCLTNIETHINRDRQLIMVFLAEAGIHAHPEELLRCA